MFFRNVRSIALSTIACLGFLLTANVGLAEGTVTISVTGNDVTVTGDDDANHVELVGNDFGVIVTGVDTELVVDGESVTTWILDPDIRDLNLFMHKGDDVIFVSGMTMGRHIDARLGQGNDTLDVRDTYVTQHLSVREGTGEFADVLNVDNVTTGRNLWVDLGHAPRDVGPQGDVIVVNACKIGERMKLVSGIGGTTIKVHDTAVEMPTKIFAGDGKSDLSISGKCVFGNNVTIVGGPNDDELRLEGTIFAAGNFRTFLGYGDDTQVHDLAGSVFAGWTRCNGGPDDDLLIVHSDGEYMDGGSPEIVQFETVID